MMLSGHAQDDMEVKSDFYVILAQYWRVIAKRFILIVIWGPPMRVLGSHM